MRLYKYVGFNTKRKLEMSNDFWNKKAELRNEWWRKKRSKYNIGLIISGIVAFILQITVVEIVSNESNYLELDMTIFTIFFQAIGYLIMIGIANLFYYLGPISEKIFEPKDSEKYRNTTFKIGFWFSCGLPLLIPLNILIMYL